MIDKIVGRGQVCDNMDLEKALQVFHIDTLDQLVDLGEIGVKTLYKKMAKDTHPDHNNGQKEEFIEINSAYGTLLDEVRHIRAQLGQTDTPSVEKKNDQMVDFFYSKTAKSQKTLAPQTDMEKVHSTLYRVQQEITMLTEEFRQEADKIKIEFEKKTQEIEAKVQRANNRLKQDLLVEFQFQAQKHTKIQDDLRAQFDKAALEIYANGLNELQEIA